MENPNREIARGRPSCISGRSKWSPPTEPWVKLNVDGSFLSSTRSVGASGNVVEALTSDVLVMNAWFGILCKCCDFIDTETMSVEVKHITRDKNMAADWIVKWSHSMTEEFTIITSPSEELKAIIRNDINEIVVA
ncbi:hypothetical protein V2J09_005562 [Rumex salicifolius]